MTIAYLVAEAIKRLIRPVAARILANLRPVGVAKRVQQIRVDDRGPSLSVDRLAFL